ncbi:hypothetical protein GGI35DRAFT_274421 [Trichoderma velutinum]
MRLCIILYCGWLGWRIFLSLSLLAIQSPETSTNPPPVYLFNCLRRFINDLYTRRPCIRGLASSARASSSSYSRQIYGVVFALTLTRRQGN